MLDYKGKIDEEAGNRPYCNHQEFVLKISTLKFGLKIFNISKQNSLNLFKKKNLAKKTT